MTFQLAKRVQQLPGSYIFGEIAKRKTKAREKGLEIIDFGIGDPDWGTPGEIVNAIVRSVRDKVNHRYPDTEGTASYRTAWAKLYQQDWGVELDPKTEIHHLIGGKEGIGHFPLAFVNPGDIVICPDPAYPVYDEGTILAGGQPYYLPTLPENGFLPDFRSVPRDVAKNTKIIWVNSPANPTGAIASLEYFGELAEWAAHNNIIVCSDATYSHINGSGQPTPSFLQVPGAKEVGVEFHSVSKTFSATGFRLGVVVGNAELIAGLHRVKASLDSGGPTFIDMAFAAYLLAEDDYVAVLNKHYTQKRRALQSMLRGLGFGPHETDATFYVWARNPERFSESEPFTYGLIEKKGVVCIPGKGLGRANGEGFTRWSVAAIREEEIGEAESLIREYMEETA